MQQTEGKKQINAKWDITNKWEHEIRKSESCFESCFGLIVRSSRMGSTYQTDTETNELAEAILLARTFVG